MALDIMVLAWNRHNNMVGLNRLMGSHSPSDNWISNDNTETNNNKSAQICFHSERQETHTISEKGITK
jgi:hypothetical protein